MKPGCRWHALWVKTLMGVLCARTLKSIYIIADRLSSNIDWSGFSILFFSLFPSNRHPLVLSYVSLIRPITAAYIIADRCDTVPVYLEIYLHDSLLFQSDLTVQILQINTRKESSKCGEIISEPWKVSVERKKLFSLSKVILCRNSISLIDFWYFLKFHSTILQTIMNISDCCAGKVNNVQTPQLHSKDIIYCFPAALLLWFPSIP